MLERLIAETEKEPEKCAEFKRMQSWIEDAAKMYVFCQCRLACVPRSPPRAIPAGGIWRASLLIEVGTIYPSLTCTCA